MVENDAIEKFNICSQLMDEGKYDEALLQSESINNTGYRAAIFIDAGSALGKSGKIREGIKLFEEILSSDQAPEFAQHSLLYNIGNGYSSLYTLRRRRRNATVPPNDNDLRTAKRYYRECLDALPDKTGPFASQAWVNYGNCLSQFGRFAEAIECYQTGLRSDPMNGMAAGNLGIELSYAARITGHYRHEYIALAHHFLTLALGPSMHLQFGSMHAVRDFQIRRDRLQQYIDAHKKPLEVPKPVKISKRNKRLNDYVNFCVDKNLFLNTWVGEKHLTPRITDEISFGPIVTSIGDDYLVPELLRILNEIKEAFSTARYLLYLSQNQNNLLDSVSKMTIYFDNLDYEVNGLYVGLCKTAYSRAFDILDKVARIINIYFEVGKREDSFWNIFAEKQSLGEEHAIRFAVRPAIQKTGNISLFALTDLCIDYFESQQVDLRTIDVRRNKITHDYLLVKLYLLEEGIQKGEVSLDSFYEETLSVLHLARYTVLYAVSAINIAESQKEHPDKVAEIPIFSSPGHPHL